MGRFSKLLETAKKPQEKQVHPPASLLANQQTSKPANLQASKEGNQQINKVVSKQGDLSVNQQNSNEVKKLTTKDKQKIGSYLTSESWIEIQTIAARTQRKDHEVLQQAVDHFLATLKK